MCKAFSTLQNLVKNQNPEKYRETVKEGLNHLGVSMEFAEEQIKAGNYFLFEHPWGAWSWKLPCVKAVLDMEGVQVVEGHQCAFGQTVMDVDGSWQLAKKPTGWMTNSPCVAAALSRRCPNEHRRESEHHRHASLVGGGRASVTERYPVRLVTAVLRALKAELTLRGSVGVLEVGETVEEDDAVSAAAKGDHTERSWTGSRGSRWTPRELRRHARRRCSTCATSRSLSTRRRSSAERPQGEHPFLWTGWT